MGIYWIKRIFFFLALIITALPAYSEKVAGKSDLPESLTSKLNKETADTTRVNTYNDIAFYILPQSTTLAIEYVNLGINLATTIDYKRGLADGYDILGSAYRQTGNYKKAAESFEQAYSIVKTLSWDKKEAAILSNRALLEADLYNYSKSLQLNLEALRLREKNNDSLAVAISMNNIGLNYQGLRDYKQALYFYNIAKNLKKTLNVKTELAATVNNIAQVFYEMYCDTAMWALDSALYYQEEAYVTWMRANDISGIIKALINMGILESERKQYEKAMLSFRAALNYSKEMNNKVNIALALYNMGLLYVIDNDIKTALQNFNNSINIAREIGDSKLIADNLKQLATCYGEMGQYTKAYDYSNEYISLIDSMTQSIDQSSLNNIIAKYEYQVKRNETIEMQAKQQAQRNGKIKLILIMVAVTLVLVSGFLIFMFIQLKKKTRY